jgi:hypothetical protein
MGKGAAMKREGGNMTTASNEGGSTSPFPPDDVREWIEKTATELRSALANPAVCSRVVELLCGDDERRARRFAELATELEGMELTMRRGSDDESD